MTQYQNITVTNRNGETKRFMIVFKLWIDALSLQIKSTETTASLY